MPNSLNICKKQQILSRRGFTLIVTLSLMILLTIVAVGLLGLSSISLRSNASGESMHIARANARVALMLAIGDLQKQLGPDTRISATADQIPGSDPSASSTPATQRHWTGAYKAWPAALPSSARPTPEFLQWFVSGQPTSVTNLTFASTTVPTNSTSSVEIVTKSSVGDPSLAVRVPLLAQNLTANAKNTYGWWVSDLGTKGWIGRAKTIPTAIADVRADQQVAPASNFKNASVGTAMPFQLVSLMDVGLSRLSSWQTGALLADKPANIRGLFHDLTTVGQGLITNVRSGGFRKDLSMALETTTPPDPVATALYQVGGETGINLQELWAYYSLPSKVTHSGSASFTTGGTMASGTPHLQVADGPVACQSDDAFYLKQPVIISYQMILSLQTRPVPVDSGTVQRLHVVCNPVITLWNPLDIPVVIPMDSLITVESWQIPYTLEISVNGGASLNYPFAASLAGSGNFMSLEIGRAAGMVFRPGEVITWSPSATTPVGTTLSGALGLNYGGLVLPVQDLAGNFVDLQSTDTISCGANPNIYTAGATPNSGSFPTGTSRHFSTTHHGYFIGDTTSSPTTSLGIGNMTIDWDFGNSRLKYTDSRGTSPPGVLGTKPSGDRLSATMSGLSTIFIPVPPRNFPASALTSSQPIMTLSFQAKTQTGSSTGTRFLSRFNPRALHVDFYNLSASERLMLPYEYRIEPLTSWSSINFDVDTDGASYFGGGRIAANGTKFVTTHSIPREPIISLAAFQHSSANGFDIQRPKFGFSTLNAREPMLPQIAHAIGNSMACPILAPTAVQGTLQGGRPVADHSYLANQALWDDWFLSGIATQTVSTFSTSRTQQIVASDFFNGSTSLAVSRYIADLRGQSSTTLLTRYFAGGAPTALATNEIASLIHVNGMFNVNSTSIEAWKSLLGGRNGRPIVVRSGVGAESVVAGGSDTPVANLLTPENRIAPGTGSANALDAGQWVGRRTLSDPEIDRLARAIVKEVRKRGPFLSLADFINRRVGTDAELARSGAIQSALDSTDSAINAAYSTVSSTASSGFPFPKAEEGNIAFGNTGVVKQADILTPIAPILSARSDTFLIRGYGERVDSTGKVIARAWCEATIQRSPQFLDPTDVPETTYSTINALNQRFGRRFELISFRWLSPSEA